MSEIIFFERVEKVRLTWMNNSFRKTGESELPVSTCTSLFCQWALDLLMYLNSGSRFVPVARAGKPAFSVRAPLLLTILELQHSESMIDNYTRINFVQLNLSSDNLVRWVYNDWYQLLIDIQRSLITCFIRFGESDSFFITQLSYLITSSYLQGPFC